MFFYSTTSSKDLINKQASAIAQKAKQEERIRSMLSQHFEKLYSSLPLGNPFNSSSAAEKCNAEGGNEFLPCSELCKLCGDCGDRDRQESQEMFRCSNKGVLQYVLTSDHNECGDCPIYRCGLCGFVSELQHDVVYHIASKHGVVDRMVFKWSRMRRVAKKRKTEIGMTKELKFVTINQRAPNQQLRQQQLQKQLPNHEMKHLVMTNYDRAAVGANDGIPPPPPSVTLPRIRTKLSRSLQSIFSKRLKMRMRVRTRMRKRMRRIVGERRHVKPLALTIDV